MMIKRDMIITPTAKILLILTQGPKNKKEIIEETGMPWTTVDQNLTWLQAMGYIKLSEGRYEITEKGLEVLRKNFAPYLKYITLLA